MIPNPPNNVKMGYLGDFNRTQYTGDIFIATAKYPPYVLVNNLINNQLSSLLDYIECDCHENTL